MAVPSAHISLLSQNSASNPHSKKGERFHFIRSEVTTLSANK